jgi:hypothetical protein
MKHKFKLLLIMAFLAGFSTSAQNSNPCNMQWGQLQEVFSHSMGRVYIRVQSSSCDRFGGICGWPKIAILHTFNEQNVSVSVSLKGTDCGGQQQVAGFSSGNAANVEDRNQANWHTFKSVQGAVAVTVSFNRGNDYYQVIWDKEKGINKTLKNNSLLLSNGKTEDEMAKEKQQQQEEKEKAAKDAEDKKRKDEEDKKQAKLDADNKAKEDAERKTASEKAAQKKEDDAIEARRIADSISWAQRNERVDNVQKQEASNESVATDMAGSVMGIMFNENLQDRDFDGKLAGLRILTGIGIENIPCIENFVSGSNARLNSSSLTSGFPVVATLGLQLSLFNKKYWRFYVMPEGQFGVSYGGGSVGYYYSYGGKGGLSIGNKIRLQVEAGYYQRIFTQQTDADATNESIGITTNTNDQYYSNFKHYLIRAAAGVVFRFKEQYTSTATPRMGYFYIGAFVDRPQYFEQEADKPVPGFELMYKAPGGFFLKGMYAPNYPFSGDAAYKIDERKNGTYFSFTLGKIFSVTK